ncbi:hypothetical protein JEZ13_06380 [bacterium]|nr:hypothetical protein [bacterium]
MEVTFVKEYCAILKGLLHYLGLIVKSPFVFLILFLFSVVILSAEIEPISLSLLEKKLDRYTLEVRNNSDKIIDIKRIEGG